MSATPGRVYVNSTYRVKARWETDAGTLTDPESVSLIVLDPGGVSTTYVYGTDDEIERAEAGVYNGDIQLNTLSGRWFYRWEGTNTDGVTVKAPTEGSFVVQASPHFDGLPSDYGRG